MAETTEPELEEEPDILVIEEIEIKSTSMEWLMTFSDVLTLLMTFFVLLISMSSMDSKKLQETFGFFSAALGNLEPGGGNRERIPIPIDVLRRSDPKQRNKRIPIDAHELEVGAHLKNRLLVLLDRAKEVVSTLSDRYRAASGSGLHPLDLGLVDLLTQTTPIRLNRREGRTEVEVHLSLLFEPGSVEFRRESKKVVTELIDLLRADPLFAVDAPVAERGIATRLFSPWELAAWRSAALSRALRAKRGLIASVSERGADRYLRLILRRDHPPARDDSDGKRRSKVDEMDATKT